MFEAISIAIFAGVMYFCLVIVPMFMEFVENNELKTIFLSIFIKDKA